jgi:hypothetical protein
LYEPNAAEEQDLVDALRKVSGRYSLDDFDSETLVKHIEHDLKLLRKVQQLVAPITPDKDAKLSKLKEVLRKMPLKEGKRLLFTQYADTAVYLYDNLNPGDKQDDIDVIYSSDKSKMKIVGRFAPKANPEYKFQTGEAELKTLVATDVLAEGLNLQDCNKIINYDLHWNPVRLIQRFGRIDRIGSDHEFVYGFNFLPEVGIERNLGLRQCLRNRIQEIHDTIGEDSAKPGDIDRCAGGIDLRHENGVCSVRADRHQLTADRVEVSGSVHCRFRNRHIVFAACIQSRCAAGQRCCRRDSFAPVRPIAARISVDLNTRTCRTGERECNKQEGTLAGRPAAWVDIDSHMWHVDTRSNGKHFFNPDNGYSGKELSNLLTECNPSRHEALEPSRRSVRTG